MTIHRHWLDWSQPCLPAAAQWLIETHANGDSSDRLCRLDHVLCIVPGKRAGRLLLEHLLRECENRGLHLVPPRSITPGVIVDVLFSPPSECAPASTLECLFAWTAALRTSQPDALAHLLAIIPGADDVLSWQELARTIQRLHDELAGQRLSFHDAAECAERLEMFSEGERWRALQAAHGRYLQWLSQAGLSCPYEPSGGSFAPADAMTNLTHITLVGIVELNAVQREAVQQVASQRITCTALVHAPQSLHDRFDSLGCVISEAWAEAQIDLDDQQFVVADRPDDQAQQAVRFIAELNQKYAADEITIGLGDAALSEPVQHAGAWVDLAMHAAEGMAVSRTLPYRLLEAVAKWLDGQRFADFASLLRHPDLESWLQRTLAAGDDTLGKGIADWISLLDKYFSEHLHQRLDGAWLGSDEQRGRLKAIHTAVQHLLKSLTTQAAQPIGDWCEPVLAVLREIYGERETMPYFTREACLTLRDALAALQNINPLLQPSTDAATALHLLLRSTADAVIAEPSRGDQIEMLGWLELHLDPAPALIVLGVNDGNIPSATAADAFLPDGLRRALGLMNNARRYARDAYLLQATLNSREKVLLVAGRRAHDGEPLAPSRLLLACDAEQLPRRVAQLCEQKHALRWPVPLGAPQQRELCQFIESPAPPHAPPVLDHMSVTSFRGYLACPYRFWLDYIEKLKAVGDDAVEMDPLIFGSFAHSALERFGRDEKLRDSADAHTIAACLLQHVDDLAHSRFGKRPAPAIRVQLERLKRRLEGFAFQQVQLRTDGWIIVTCEFRLPEQTYLNIPGQEPMRISGIIDRIDRHAKTGALRLIDYKTSEAGATPFQIHHGTKKYKDDCWLDLQLPLYRFLAAQHGYANAEVGYIVLPKNPGDVAYLPGEWTEEQFDSAIEKAREIVTDIRAGKFEPNPDYRSTEFDDFANICRVSVLGGEDEDEGDDA